MPLLRAIHGGSASVLGEDFCGTAALSRAWVRQVPEASAVAVDRDGEPLVRAAGDDAVRAVHADVRDADQPVDVLYVGNFSIGEWHARPDLVAYLQHARRRLRPGGVFICDLYGGETAFLTGDVVREEPGPDGAIIRYTWEQRETDPLTGRVINALHFRVLRDGAEVQSLTDAFVYDWRLWGVPELRDALLEAGFTSTEVYPRVPDAIDDDARAYVAPLSEVDDSFDVLIAARG